MSTNQYPNENQPRKSGSGGCLKAAGIGCLVIVVAAVGFGLIGYSKLMKNPEFRNVFQQSQTMGRCGANLGLIGQALPRYASDHGGQYPAKLADLYPKYITNQAQLQCPTSAKTGMGCEYEYTKPAPNAPDDTVVVVCRHHVLGKGQPSVPIMLRKNGKIESDTRNVKSPQTNPTPAPSKP